MKNMYIFEETTKNDCFILDSWNKHENIKEWIGIEDWFEYLEYTNSNPDYFVINALYHNDIISSICMEIIEEIGYISIMVNPEEHSKGHGKKILSLFLQKMSQIVNRKIKYIQAGIDPENVVSKRCFESVGFEFDKNGEDGEMIYLYEIKE